MTPRITDAKYIDGYKLFIRFADGSEGEIDFEPELTGDVFEPLKELSYFKQFSVNRDIHTIVWPNGADFAPEFLYESIRVTV
ncbi:MAG: DUF2442 domain-containing protein [Desulfobacterales bacterium]|nr:DUF2442 domain-containing protein [Desulfobacterales bacterium]